MPLRERRIKTTPKNPMNTTQTKHTPLPPMTTSDGLAALVAVKMKKEHIPNNTLQNSVVVKSRNKPHEHFLGTSNRGVFIIETDFDARVMAQFYRDRIASERTHLERLLYLSAGAGLEI